MTTIQSDVSGTSQTEAKNAVRSAATPSRPSATTKWKSPPTWLRAGATALAATALLWATPAIAGHITTTTQLRQACESSPGNVVVLDHSTKISSGPPEQVGTGGTLVLRPGVALEFEGVSITFAGALVVQGASSQKAEIKLSRSELNARSIEFDVPGAGSTVTSGFSSMRASAGNLVIDFGDEGKLEFTDRLLSGPSYGLSAAGAVEISGGRKLSGLLGDTVVETQNGFLFLMGGDEGAFKVDQLIFYAPLGSFTITASGAKGRVEMQEANISFRDTAAIRLLGNESAINLKQVVMGPYSATAARGVTIEAGAASAELGKVEASEISIFDVARIAVRASLGGQKGVLKLEKSSMSANSDLLLETGSQGVTAVKENSLFSETRIRIAHGLGGSCTVENNTIVAPIKEICP